MILKLSQQTKFLRRMDPASVAMLGLAGLYAFYLATYNPSRAEDVQGVDERSGIAEPAVDRGFLDTNLTTATDFESKKDGLLLDYAEGGIVYGIEKTQLLNMTNLNEAFKPWSAPMQKPTYSMGEFMESQANKNAYLEANAAPFYFWRDGEIPLGSNQQAAVNIELPSTSSIRGDPNASLYTNFPRSYIDGGFEAHPPDSRASDKLLGSGEPEEFDEPMVPEEGKLNRDMNPYGPGGVIQTLMNERASMRTEYFGTNRSHIIGSTFPGGPFR